MDYVVKPFSPTELTARIRAALRRRATPEPSESYVLGDLVIDYGERRTTLAGRPPSLVAMGYGLLAELSANAGRVLTYEHLLERVWCEKSSGDVRPTRTIVTKFRRIPGYDVGNPTCIFTEPHLLSDAEVGGIKSGRSDGRRLYHRPRIRWLHGLGEAPTKAAQQSCIRRGVAAIIRAGSASRPLVGCGVADDDKAGEPSNPGAPKALKA